MFILPFKLGLAQEQVKSLVRCDHQSIQRDLHLFLVSSSKQLVQVSNNNNKNCILLLYINLILMSQKWSEVRKGERQNVTLALNLITIDQHKIKGIFISHSDICKTLPNIQFILMQMYANVCIDGIKYTAVEVTELTELTELTTGSMTGSRAT